MFYTHAERLEERGIELSRVPETGEYRVAPFGARDANAYFTDDLRDAINTGDALADSAEENSVRMRLRSLLPAFDAR